MASLGMTYVLRAGNPDGLAFLVSGIRGKYTWEGELALDMGLFSITFDPQLFGLQEVAWPPLQQLGINQEAFTAAFRHSVKQKFQNLKKNNGEKLKELMKMAPGYKALGMPRCGNFDAVKFRKAYKGVKEGTLTIAEYQLIMEEMQAQPRIGSGTWNPGPDYWNGAVPPVPGINNPAIHTAAGILHGVPPVPVFGNNTNAPPPGTAHGGGGAAAAAMAGTPLAFPFLGTPAGATGTFGATGTAGGGQS